MLNGIQCAMINKTESYKTNTNFIHEEQTLFVSLGGSFKVTAVVIDNLLLKNKYCDVYVTDFCKRRWGINGATAHLV